MDSTKDGENNTAINIKGGVEHCHARIAWRWHNLKLLTKNEVLMNSNLCE